MNPESEVAQLTCAQDRERQPPGGQRPRVSQERPEIAASWSHAVTEELQPSTPARYRSRLLPDQQRALGPASSDFAAYIAQLHQRVHPHFAGDLLAHLDDLPCTDALNDYHLSVELELVLSSADGHVAELGVLRTSGVEAFDVLALEAVLSSDPFGKPPAPIVSNDGNVYVRWQFRRHPFLACSAHFVVPYLF